MSANKPTLPKKPYIPVLWANIYLDQSQKEQAKLLASDHDHLFSLMSDLIAAEYTVSFAVSPATNSFVCTLICKAEGDPNEGWGMSTHGGDWVAALARSMFKHYILGDGFTYAELAERYGQSLT